MWKLLLLLCALPCAASTITQNVTVNETCTTEAVFCPLAFTFDQAPGVTSVDWTFTDTQTVGWGYNSVYYSGTGGAQPTLDISTATGVYSFDLPLRTEQTEDHALTFWQGGVQSSHTCCTYGVTLSASGSADPSMFNGTGQVTINLEQLWWANIVTNVPNVAGAVNWVANSATLSLVEDQTEIPEPRWTALLIVVALLGQRVRR